jgi:hypothetical protein
VKDLTRYATATPTDTMEAFADFLIVKVYGGALPEGIDEASFRTGVALGGSTRNYFQSSDEWKNDERNYLANVEANRAAKIEAAKERAVATKAKADARLAALEAKLAEAVEAAKAKAVALAGAVDAEDEEAVTDGPLLPADEEPEEGSEGPVEGPVEGPASGTEEPRRSRRGNRAA